MSRVRPFIMTGGRTRAERRDLRVETLLQTTRRRSRRPSTPSRWRSSAPASSRSPWPRSRSKLGLVLGVVTVLAGDLITEGLLEVHQTDPVEIELDALTRMLERVKNL